MQSTLNPQELEAYVFKLMNLHFPDDFHPNYTISWLIERTLQRVEYCFSHIHLKYYRNDHGVVFDHLNSDHFASFLYFLGNTIWSETQDTEVPTRLFYLNKIMHGIDLFYSVKMPDIFLLVHPLGSVLGNASYGDYLAVYQNVTVGADEAGIYPNFGIGTVLYAKSTIIGECKLGNDVIFGANSFILNADVPAGTLVVGQHPLCRFISSSFSVAQRVFNRD